MSFIIYDVFMNEEASRFGGAEWIVDGEIGRMIYPGNWDKSVACAYYAHGWAYSHEEVA